MGEFVSQCKLFVDANATPGGIGGLSKPLTKIKEFDIKDGRSTEVMMAVGVDQGAGFRDKQGGGEISLTVFRETGPFPEVNWHKFKSDRKTFTFTKQDESSGQRESFTCRVSKIDDKGDDGGTNEMGVSLVYTKRY